MKRQRKMQPVVNHDLCWFALAQAECTAGHLGGVLGGHGSLLHHEGELGAFRMYARARPGPEVDASHGHWFRRARHSGSRTYRHAHDEAGHIVFRVRVRVVVVGARAAGGALGGVALRVGHVPDEMAMKKPIARFAGDPAHPECGDATHPVRDHVGAGLGRIHRVHVTITARVHVEVEPVQVHRMYDPGRVDHAPAHGVADGVHQAFRVWPRRAVDEHLEGRAVLVEDAG